MKCRYVALLICFLMALTGCGSKDKQDDNGIKPIPSPSHDQLANTTQATSAKQIDTLVLTPVNTPTEYEGTVMMPDVASLGFELSGLINSVSVKPGDRVKQNQVIAKLDQTDIFNHIEQIKARDTYLTKQYEKAGDLLKKGYISKLEYERIETNYNQVKEDLAKAQDQLQKTTLVAPNDGEITEVLAEPNAQIDVNQPVVKITSNVEVDVTIKLPGEILQTINEEKSNIQAEVTFLDDSANNTYPANFKTLPDITHAATDYEVVLTLSNTNGIKVLPNMKAKVSLKFQDGKQMDAFNVPAEAVMTSSDGKTFVWVVDDAQTVHKTPVKIQSLQSGQVRIVQGVQPGERIVSNGVTTLKENEKIEVISDSNQSTS
ncbi:MAG: efflux RND transporter periplasmic adaptor subunit [Gammaproteobacteria bacterium]